MAGRLKSLDKWRYTMTSLSQPTRRFQLKRRKKDCHQPTPNHLDGRIPGKNWYRNTCLKNWDLAALYAQATGPEGPNWPVLIKSIIWESLVQSRLLMVTGDRRDPPHRVPHSFLESSIASVLQHLGKATQWTCLLPRLLRPLHFHVPFIVRVLRFTTLAT